MTANNKIPALRFKEFEGEWEEKALGEFGEFNGGGTQSTTNEGFWSGNIPWVSSSDLIEGDIRYLNITRYISLEAVEKSATKIISEKSILIVSRVGVGKVAVNEIEVCTSQDFQSLILRDGHYIFMALLIQIKTKELLGFNQGTSIKGIVKSDLMTFQINVPSFVEQQKIARFLTAVDDKIQQLTKKKALLEQYKKGVMQQIFNQQIRFKDDDGKDYSDWETTSFGVISNIKRGASPRPISDKKWFDESSKIGWVRISDVTRAGKYLERTEQYLSNAGIKQSRLIEKGNLIMSICATIGKPVYTNFSVCIHDGFVVF